MFTLQSYAGWLSVDVVGGGSARDLLHMDLIHIDFTKFRFYLAISLINTVVCPSKYRHCTALNLFSIVSVCPVTRCWH